MSQGLLAGAAIADITPAGSVFLYGYPHVKRYSTGVHDRLLSSALYLSDGQTGAIFIANDLVFVAKASATRVRQRIAQQTGIPPANIMVTATHTHSGPLTVDYLSCSADPVIPRTDGAYLRQMEDALVDAGVRAVRSAQPAQAGLGVATATGVGTNRRDPTGPADGQVPVLMVRTADGRRNIACMVVYAMHPTVLHEDSTLISGDFPAMARQYLQKHVLGEDCPVVYHSGAAGNQSPRHVVRGQTFAEAQRLGDLLGAAIQGVIPAIQYRNDLPVSARQTFFQLPRRQFPQVGAAELKLKRAIERFEHLKNTNAPRAQTRTAECDWFGAEETLTLARAQVDGRLSIAADVAMPAEVQIIRVGPWAFVGWPGEMFVEFALAAKAARANTFVISLANGELQGYLVTQEAVEEGGYEASQAFFASPASGNLLVETTLNLLRNA